MKKRSNNNEKNRNFKPSQQIKEVEEIIEINDTVKITHSKNELFEYFESLKEISSSDKKSKFKIRIKILNGFDTLDCFNLRLFGLNGKSKEKKLTKINSNQSVNNLYEFDFKSFTVGQIIGLSLRWMQDENGNCLYKRLYLNLIFLNINYFFCIDKSKWSIEFIEVNDLANNINIKYVPNENWSHVKFNNEKFTNYLIISDKSNKQIQDFNKLVDILNMNDFKPYKLDEIIWLDNILLEQDGLYNTFSKELRAKFHHFISVISLTVTYNEIQSDKPKYEIMIKRFVQKVESLSNQIVKSDCEREKIEINNELVEISLNNQGWFMTTV